MRILCVMQGADGGIGRFEVLLAVAWRQLAARTGIEVECIAQAQHPDIFESPLEGKVWSAEGRRGAFVCAVIRSWLRGAYDLAVFTHVNLARMGPLLTQLRPGTRYVTITYGMEVWDRLPLAKRVALQRSERIWSISDFTRRVMIARARLDPNRTRCLPLAIGSHQLERFAQNQTSKRRSSGALLSVCRMERTEQHKGIEHVLMALPGIAHQVPNVSYTIVGGGSDVPRLRQIADRAGVVDRVTFTGPIPDGEVVRAYGECDVFILPSRSEGFGLVFLEAMASGRPVVAANVGATSEVVRDGVTGILVPYGDVAAIEDAVTRLLLDGEMREKYGEAAARRVETAYTFERFADRVATLVAELGSPSRGAEASSDSRIGGRVATSAT